MTSTALFCSLSFSLLLFLPHIAFATVGVDVSQPVSQSAFQCLAKDGYSFAIVRCYRSTGSVDPNAAATVSNAWAGGMSHVDVYMFPCPTCGNAAGQIQDAVNSLKNAGANFGMLWLDIEGPQYWMDQQSNQNFFQSLISTGANLGISMGVYTSASQWGPIMGNGFTAGSAYPLWYAHYDNQQSFSDFSSFGGWTTPSIKQFQGDASVCGAGVDLNWYP